MLSTKTVSRLRKVQKALIAEAMAPKPKLAFVMDYFHLGLQHVSKERIVSDQPICNTAACLGGTAAAIFQPALFDKIVHGEDTHTDLEQIAKKVLGLTSEQASRLFYLYNWSTEAWSRELTDAYYAAKTRMTRAAVAYDRIERFIETNGAE